MGLNSLTTNFSTFFLNELLPQQQVIRSKLEKENILYLNSTIYISQLTCKYMIDRESRVDELSPWSGMETWY